MNTFVRTSAGFLGTNHVSFVEVLDDPALPPQERVKQLSVKIHLLGNTSPVQLLGDEANAFLSLIYVATDISKVAVVNEQSNSRAKRAR